MCGTTSSPHHCNSRWRWYFPYINTGLSTPPTPANHLEQRSSSIFWIHRTWQCGRVACIFVSIPYIHKQSMKTKSFTELITTVDERTREQSNIIVIAIIVKQFIIIFCHFVRHGTKGRCDKFSNDNIYVRTCYCILYCTSTEWLSRERARLAYVSSPPPLQRFHIHRFNISI